MHDLTIAFGDREDGLAVMGEALGNAGISIEGGGMFTLDGHAIGHFLVADGEAARPGHGTGEAAACRTASTVALTGSRWRLVKALCPHAPPPASPGSRAFRR